jgi:hypothetical protein
VECVCSWKIAALNAECDGRSKIVHLSAYQKVLKLGRERENTMLLPVVLLCDTLLEFDERTVGSDLRKARPRSPIEQRPEDSHTNFEVFELT